MIDIAKKANVSSATVSRVVNKLGVVKPETVEKVNRAIKELNYEPNQVARSLKMSRSRTVALIVSDISNAYFAKLSLIVEKYFHEKNYTLIVCSTSDNKEKELQDLKMLSEKKVEGLIINTTGLNNEYLAQLSKSIPMVLCNRSIEDFELFSDFVDSDNKKATRELTRMLIDSGHKKIGVINGPLFISSANERYEGYLKEINSDIVTIVYDGNYEANSGYDAAKHFINDHPDVTAIISMNGPMTIGVLNYCNEHGIRIPEDISLVSATDIINQELFKVNPTTAVMDSTQIGEQVSKFLYERIKNTQKENRVVRFESEILTGNSIKDI